MAARRHDQRKGTRRPGAGRPRKVPRSSTRPVDEEIVGEASRLFARQGVAATTMAEVADAAGLQVSSLYYYFRSKDEILERIVGEVNRVPLDLLDDAIAVHPDTARRLHAFIRADVAALCRFPFDINEIHALARASIGGFEVYWSERRELEARLEALVGTGVDDGELIAVVPRIVALTILANDESSQSWYRPPVDGRGEDPGVAPEELGLFVADLTLRGLLTDPDALPAVRADTASGS